MLRDCQRVRNNDNMPYKSILYKGVEIMLYKFISPAQQLLRFQKKPWYNGSLY